MARLFSALLLLCLNINLLAILPLSAKENKPAHAQIHSQPAKSVLIARRVHKPDTTASTTPAREVRAAAAGSHIFAAPVLVPGQASWITVINAYGRPLPNTAVHVNGQAIATDFNGLATIATPRSGSLALSISDSEGKVIDQKSYSTIPGGMLALNTAGSSLFSKLCEPASDAADKTPYISYSPNIVEPGQLIVICGHGFSTEPFELDLSIDNLSAPILSASSTCILAKVPNNLPLGPLREIFVRSGDMSSSLREVDVSNAEFIQREKTITPGKSYSARLQVIGTNFPCLVQLDNKTPSVISISTASGNKIAAISDFVTQGGERNIVPLQFSTSAEQPFLVECHIMQTIPGVSGIAFGGDSAAGEIDKGLWKQTEAGVITRLQRRLNAVESSLNRIKGQLSSLKAGDNGAEAQKLTQQQHIFSERKTRLQAMIATSHVLFISLGASESEYKQALELASGPEQNKPVVHNAG